MGWDRMGQGLGAQQVLSVGQKSHSKHLGTPARRKAIIVSPLTTPADTMGTARETPGSIRRAKDRANTLAWAHRKSARHEIIKVVK